MSQRIENNEVQRQSLVKNAFKQLLSRLNARKSSPPRHNHSKIIKQKSQQYQKCRRYSAGFKYRPKQLSSQSANKNPPLILSFSNTPTNFSQTCFSNWTRKEAVSSRCKTQSRNKTMHSLNKRLQENSPMLIAKSFVFQQFQPRRTEHLSFWRDEKPKQKEQNQRINFGQNYSYKKNHRRQQQRIFNFKKAMKNNQEKRQQYTKKDIDYQYQPWQTELLNDSF